MPVIENVIGDVVSSSTAPVPLSYDFALFGDSQIDPPATDTVDTIGYGFNAFTPVPVTQTSLASGGWRLDQIRITFTNSFPIAGTNAVILQGGINDITQDRDIELMKADMQFMADTVINANFPLVIIGIGPIGTAHASYTLLRAVKVIDFNAWLRNTFPLFFVDIYSDLEGPGLRDFDFPFHKSTTDLHFSDNACRAIEQRMGDILYSGPDYPTLENPGNAFPESRNLTTWNIVAAAVGGPIIKTADGSFSREKGILSTDTALAIHLIRSNMAQLPDNSNVVISVLVRPGTFRWVRIQWTNNAGINTNFDYIDTIDMIRGAGSAQVWTVSKAANGWALLELRINNGTGASINQIQIQPAGGDGVGSVQPINTQQPLIYADLAQIYLDV